ncbi:MAG: hypothetical protein ABSC89_02245 [Verrucomicrobiota bacterium]|jgi:hypothetical protein
MRTLKLILGIGCFVTALLPASLAFLVISNLGDSEPLLTFCFASVLAVLAISLVCSGWLFITQRGLPMSRKAKVLVALPYLCVGIFVAGAPYFIKARSTSSMNACINNLRQIDAAANEFALEKDKKTGEAINFPDDLTPYIKLNKDGKIPPCPQGGIYSIKKVGDVPTCSLGTTVNPAHVLP